MAGFLRPATWHEALQLRAAHPDAVVVAGGTDICVDINFGRLRPESVLDISKLPELKELSKPDGWLRIGAGVTYSRLLADIAADVPGLAAAARTVGSPQIRNRGTIGGNLGTASPAGDCHPPLLASAAVIETASVHGVRQIPAAEFFLSPKRSALRPDELISAVLVRPASGPQIFAKVGTRNAMVIAACSVALALDAQARRVGTGIGAAGPVPLRAPDAERFLADSLADGGLWDRPAGLPEELIAGFANRVAAAARPIDDVRGSAAYRRHAVEVLAGRALRWAWNEYRRMA
ncbi:MAG: FAD binding domain-containing protein [Streptosporangiaceae bacterium]